MGLYLERNYEIYVKHFTGTQAVSHLGHSSLQLPLDFMDDWRTERYNSSLRVRANCVFPKRGHVSQTHFTVHHRIRKWQTFLHLPTAPRDLLY